MAILPAASRVVRAKSNVLAKAPARTANGDPSSVTLQKREARFSSLRSVFSPSTILMTPRSIGLLTRPGTHRYLQDLHDDVQHRRRSSTHGNLGLGSRSPTQLSSHRTPASSSPLAARQGKEQLRRSPTSLSGSSGRDAPPIALGCESGTALGMNPGVVGDRRNSTIVSVSPLLEAEAMSAQRSELGSTSGPDSRGDLATSSAYPHQHINSPPGVWSNPFTMPAKTMKNTRKNKRTWGKASFLSVQHWHTLLPANLTVPSVWLATWSTWSFTKRLMLMLSERLCPTDPSLPDNITDPDIYNLTWDATSPPDGPDLSGLPSENHAIYLFNTVKFHFGQTFRLFDEARFEREIRGFYAKTLQGPVEHRVWFAKFLLMLAFGTAFHAKPIGSREPPGAKFFGRAMTLIPDTTSLWKDSLLGIEVLALVALYTCSIDERETAYIFVSATHPIRPPALGALVFAFD